MNFRARKGLDVHDANVTLADIELLAEGGSGAWSGFNFLAPQTANHLSSIQKPTSTRLIQPTSRCKR